MFMKLVEITLLDEPPKYDGRLACTEQAALCGKCLTNTIGYLVDTRCLVCLHSCLLSPRFKASDRSF
jgi:hypothetical protein